MFLARRAAARASKARLELDASMRLRVRRRRRQVLAAGVVCLPWGPAAGGGRTGDANLVTGCKRIRRTVHQPVGKRQSLENFDLGTEIASELDRLELDRVVRTDGC